MHRPWLLRCTVDKRGRVSRVHEEEGSMKRAGVVCFVNHTAVTGGAEFALNRLVAGMDRSRWHPVVVFGDACQTICLCWLSLTGVLPNEYA